MCSGEASSSCSSAPSDSASCSSAGNPAAVFEDGICDVRLLNLERSGDSHRDGLPPKPLLLGAPSNAGDYPIVMLLHGFSLCNTFYSQLMQHVASHGFIVIAPQMYRFAGPDAAPEIQDAATLINWIPGNLSKLLSPQVKPLVTKLAVIGHSRGGKVAFGLALGLAATKPLAAKIAAIVGLDPVDGTSDGNQTNPPILKFQKDSLELGCPALIIGAGLGTERKNFLVPACAPEQVGHRAFFRDCCSPAFLFTAPEHGHNDFLDDDTKGFRGRLTSLVCKNGDARRPMRRFTGGAIVAFLRAVFNGDGATFRHLLGNPSAAPVKLNPPESYGEI